MRVKSVPWLAEAKHLEASVKSISCLFYAPTEEREKAAFDLCV
jgi:hypothetical protein